jgi:glutamate dehydrogenase
MPHRQAARKAEQLEAVRALVSERLAPDDVNQAVRFVEDFYRHVPPGDMARHDPETLYGAALSALDFLRQRQPDEPGVRVLNPVYEQHGYHIEHTVLEIVTDDMPFLVDSVTAALTGLGMVV